MTYPGGGLTPDLRPELKKLLTTQERLDTALRKAGLGWAAGTMFPTTEITPSPPTAIIGPSIPAPASRRRP